MYLHLIRPALVMPVRHEVQVQPTVLCALSLASVFIFGGVFASLVASLAAFWSL
jgi:hypothetical protein